jgi:hypothetical protein
MNAFSVDNLQKHFMSDLANQSRVVLVFQYIFPIPSCIHQNSDSSKRVKPVQDLLSDAKRIIGIIKEASLELSLHIYK